MVLAVVDDLLFSSKIRAVSEHTGRPVEFVRKRADVLPAIRRVGARLVIIDLDRPSLEPFDLVREIRAAGDLTRVRTVGFVSHVRTDRIEAARQAGIDVVLARSAFVAKLPELLASGDGEVRGSEGPPFDSAQGGPSESRGPKVRGSEGPRVPAFAEIDEAAARLAGWVWHTPLIQSEWLSAETGAEVWLKLEHVQVTGSYKARGAVNALSRLRERHPERTRVVAASAGNHGLALAWAAKRLGVSARIHVPVTAPAAKRTAIARLGAELVEAPTYDEAESRAIEDARESGAHYVSPYNDPDVIAGAATVAREMLADEPGLDAIIVPTGGGGLLSGSAIAARAAGSKARILGAEAAASPAFSSALAAGRIVTVDVTETLADTLAGNLERHSATFDIVRDMADRVVVVNEAAIAAAMRDLVWREHLVVEGAGAIAVGALRHGGLDLAGLRVGVMLTGRNVDSEVLRAVLSPKS